MTFAELGAEHAAAFLVFAEELRRLDRGTFDLWFHREWNDLTFAAYLRECETERRDWRPKAKQISTTRYVLSDAEGVIGVGILRFPLTPAVESSGGNVVVITAPSRRRRGLGTALMNHTLREAARAGLARARVSCPADDAAARGCILKNQGESTGVRDGRDEFWIRLR